jgi:hypothetical protein
MLFFSATAPIFAMARICGAVPEETITQAVMGGEGGMSREKHFLIVVP